MQLDRCEQAGHDRLPQLRGVQNVQTGVCRGGVHQGAAGRRVRAAERRMGAQQLSAAVGTAGVGVHDAARQLDELTHMPDEQHLCEVLRRCHIQRLADEI